MPLRAESIGEPAVRKTFTTMELALSVALAVAFTVALVALFAVYKKWRVHAGTPSMRVEADTVWPEIGNDEDDMFADFWPDALLQSDAALTHQGQSPTQSQSRT